MPSPVTLAAAANVSNSYGCTISNSDSQVVAESFGLLITTIDASVAPEKQKQEAKDLLKAFVSHPLAIQLLGELAEQLASLLGKKKPKKAVTPTGR